VHDLPNSREGERRPGGPLAWYLIRTKQHKERVCCQRLTSLVEDVYLPLLRASGRQRFVARQPLFPCYLFARFKLKERLYRIMHTPGVAGIVPSADEPCEVNAGIVDYFRTREKDGVIVLNLETFRLQPNLTIIWGDFREVDRLFERYLSGPERTLLLMDSIGTVRT